MVKLLLVRKSVLNLKEHKSTWDEPSYKRESRQALALIYLNLEEEQVVHIQDSRTARHK